MIHAKNRRARNEIGAEGRTQRNIVVSKGLRIPTYVRCSSRRLLPWEQGRTHEGDSSMIHPYEMGETVVHTGRSAIFSGFHEMIPDVCYIRYFDTPNVTHKVRLNTLSA